MAVVGFEVDQVIQTANGDISVPINAAYNHHFDGSLNNGAKSVFEKLSPGDPRIAELEGCPRIPLCCVSRLRATARLPGFLSDQTSLAAVLSAVDT